MAIVPTCRSWKKFENESSSGYRKRGTGRMLPVVTITKSSLSSGKLIDEYQPKRTLAP